MDERRIRLGTEADHQVELAAGECPHQRPRRVLAGAHPHPRATPGVLGQNRLGDVVHPGRYPEPQLPTLAARVGLGQLIHGVGCRHGRPGVHEQLRARLGERHVVARALEQFDAELELEPLDLLAQSRLRDSEALARPAEVELVGERGE